MPSLADLQQHFAQAVMGHEAPDALFIGCVPPTEALAIHRNTIIGALVTALRVSYPTVEALVGEEFFDQAAAAFAEETPSETASLAAYGERFAEFLASFLPATSLSYLPDVARLDRAVEMALRAPDLRQRFALDTLVSIDLPQSLVVLHLAYPADEIRASLGNDSALAAIDTRTAERSILVWRKGFAAAVQPVDAVSGRFLASLLAGESAEASFASAIAATDEASAVHAIQTGIFSAPFCTIISTAEELSP